MNTTWEHKLYATADNSISGIDTIIRTQEKDGWQLVALGPSEESLRLIFKRPVQAPPYVLWEHEIVKLAADKNASRRQINKEIEKLITECGAQGWTVTAVGESPEGVFLITTRPIEQGG